MTDLPAEVFLSIVSCGLSKSDLNSLSQVSLSFSNIFRPILYQRVDLERSRSSDSYIATLRFLSRSCDIAGQVREFHTAGGWIEAGREVSASDEYLFSVLIRVLLSMSRLEKLTVNHNFKNKTQQRQFLRLLRLWECPLRVVQFHGSYHEWYQDDEKEFYIKGLQEISFRSQYSVYFVHSK